MRSKAWPKHKPGRKETGRINQKNKLIVVESNIPGIPIPLKRKYLTYRAYMQAPVGSPAQPPRNRNRPYFPMGRIRAIKSSLAS